MEFLCFSFFIKKMKKGGQIQVVPLIAGADKKKESNFIFLARNGGTGETPYQICDPVPYLEGQGTSTDSMHLL